MSRRKCVLLPVLLLASSATLHAQVGPVTVSATANIFGAGHSTPPAPGGGGGGTLPVAAGSPFQAYGPDGNPNFPTDVFSWDGVSGIQVDTFLFLTAVFLDDTEPVDPAPPRLDFSGAADYVDLEPQLAQTFFVGDGMGGLGGAETQVVRVPAGATRLFLGFVDQWGGLPGWYDDNTGQFDIQAIPFFRAPELAVSPLQAGVQAALTVTDVTPFGKVAFLYSLTGPGRTAVGSPCGALSVSLAPPIFLAGFGQSDAGGTASLTGRVPLAAQGRDVTFQAVDLATCTRSQVVTATVH